MSHAEMLFAMLRAVDKHVAERHYDEAAYALELAAQAARAAAQASPAHRGHAGRPAPHARPGRCQVIRAALLASLRAHRIRVVDGEVTAKNMTAATFAGLLLEAFPNVDAASAAASLVLEYLARVQDEERAPTLPPMPAAVDHSAIVEAIRGRLTEGTSSADELLVEGIAMRLEVPEDRVRFAVDCMLKDGGLRRTERGLLYVPLPNDDAEPYDPPAARPQGAVP